MKKLLSIFSIILLVSSLWATDGDQMVGVTALQWARGGAVVASPVDVPSIIYNPAALGVLKFNNMAFDMSLGVMNPPRHITSPLGETESNSNLYLGMGNGFAAKINDKLFFGVAAGGVAGMGVDFPSGVFPDNPGTPFDENAGSVVSKKGLLKITPTVAFKPNEKLTVGVSLQIGQQSLALKNAVFALPQTEKYGFGAALGLIYQMNPKMQFGLSYTSKMNIAEYTFNGTGTFGDGEYTLDMDSPQNVAFGAAFFVNPKLMVEADVKWYNFSDVNDEITLTTPTNEMPLTFGWDDQIVYALGINFKAKPGMCVKVGYNYGATPISAEDVTSNTGSIAVVEHHLSLGLTKHWNDKVSSTFSYTRGFYNEVESEDGSVTIDAEQNIAFLQFSFRL